MRFLVDNNLSPKLVAGMKAFGEDVVHLTDILGRDAADTQIMPHVVSKGWCLVTRDFKIRYRPAERKALMEHGVRAFSMGAKNLNRCQLIQQLVRSWPKMKELAEKTCPPFAFRVPRRGVNIKPIRRGDFSVKPVRTPLADPSLLNLPSPSDHADAAWAEQRRVLYRHVEHDATFDPALSVPLC